MSSSHDRDAASVEAARTNVRVDLPDAFQAEIRELARVLPELDYFQLLGIARGAPAEEIRDAFFERSKRFHPDRYMTWIGIWQLPGFWEQTHNRKRPCSLPDPRMGRGLRRSWLRPM